MMKERAREKKGLRDSQSNESDFVVCYAIICHHNATLTEVEWILYAKDDNMWSLFIQHEYALTPDDAQSINFVLFQS